MAAMVKGSLYGTIAIGNKIFKLDKQSQEKTKK